MLLPRLYHSHGRYSVLLRLFSSPAHAHLFFSQAYRAAEVNNGKESKALMSHIIFISLVAIAFFFERASAFLYAAFLTAIPFLTCFIFIVLNIYSSLFTFDDNWAGVFEKSGRLEAAGIEPTPMLQRLCNPILNPLCPLP